LMLKPEASFATDNEQYNCESKNGKGKIHRG